MLVNLSYIQNFVQLIQCGYLAYLYAHLVLYSDTGTINFCSSSQVWGGWLLEFSQRTKLLGWAIKTIYKSGCKTHKSEHVILYIQTLNRRRFLRNGDFSKLG